MHYSYHYHCPYSLVDRTRSGIRDPRIAERSDKRCERARLCHFFPAISRVTCRRDAGMDLTFMSRLTFHGDRTYQRISRMSAHRAPVPTLPEDDYPFRNGEALGRFDVVNCHLRGTLLNSVLQVLDCACIHFDVAAVKCLREGRANVSANSSTQRYAICQGGLSIKMAGSNYNIDRARDLSLAHLFNCRPLNGEEYQRFVWNFGE